MSNKLEIFALLVCYAAQVGISYRRYGTTCRSHLPRANHLTLEGGTGRLSRNYQYTLRNVPEQRRSSFTPRRKPGIQHYTYISAKSHNRSTGRQIMW